MPPSRPTAVDQEHVRCVTCRTVYELPVRTPSPDGPAGCPHCGAVAWVALAFGGGTRP